MNPIGVLALQGDFAEHLRVLKSINAPAMEVRNKEDLAGCSALIIPGGESTTIALLLQKTGLGPEIKKRIAKGMPFYGTCAGAIIAAKKVLGEKRFKPLNLIDIDVKRNDYGRQVDSFETELEVKGIGKVNGVFIRAPVISRAGKGVEVLSSLGGKPVFVNWKNVLCGTFHPETENNSFAHEMLVQMCKK